MKDSNKDKYLGDIVHSSGNIRHRIEERKDKGFAIVAEMLAILDDIPLERCEMEIGLKLRQAMLLNGILFNSEAWHDVKEKEVKMLESVDEHLLRSLVAAHSKTPLEFLYLETGAVPIRYIISSRRMIYLHCSFSCNGELDYLQISKSHKKQVIQPESLQNFDLSAFVHISWLD